MSGKYSTGKVQSIGFKHDVLLALINLLPVSLLNSLCLTLDFV